MPLRKYFLYSKYVGTLGYILGDFTKINRI